MATKTKKSKSSENELLKLLQKTFPFFERHGNTLLLAVAAVLASAAVLIFMSKWTATGDDIGWAEMSAANTTEDYAKIAERFPGTPVGMWAKLIEADSYQQSAVRLAFEDREASRTELQRATDKYEALLKLKLSRTVEEKALFGLAKCVEAACSGDTSDAIAAYERVLKKFPDSIYKEAIDQRIVDLKKPETKEFYAFWHAQNPKPGDRVGPGDAMPLNNQEVTLPETPLLLQQPGFSAADGDAEMPAPPDFEPADPKTPIQPELQPDSTSESEAPDTKSESADANPADAKPADQPEADAPDKASDKTPTKESAADPATDGNNSK